MKSINTNINFFFVGGVIINGNFIFLYWNLISPFLILKKRIKKIKFYIKNIFLIFKKTDHIIIKIRITLNVFYLFIVVLALKIEILIV